MHMQLVDNLNVHAMQMPTGLCVVICGTLASKEEVTEGAYCKLVSSELVGLIFG